MPETRFSAGFSLVELMIALVIASVLAAMVYPSYRDHLIRSALPEATGGLSLYAMRMEEYYQDHRTYVDSKNACGAAPPSAAKFGFACSPGNQGQSYQLSATGKSGDLVSFTFTLDHRGNQATTALPSGWGDPVSCWIQKKGSC